jgi:hypothetical protein
MSVDGEMIGCDVCGKLEKRAPDEHVFDGLPPGWGVEDRYDADSAMEERLPATPVTMHTCSAECRSRVTKGAFPRA